MLEREIGHTCGRQAALNDDGIRPLSHHRRKGTTDFVGPADHHDGPNFYACRATSELSLLKEGLREQRICSVGQNSHTPRGRKHISEQLD